MAASQIAPSQLTDAARWGEEIGRTTLTVAGNTISVTGLPARKYLKILIFTKGTATTDEGMRFNNDSGNNYDYIRNINANTSDSATAQSRFALYGDNGADSWGVYEVTNLAAQVKSIQGRRMVSYPSTQAPAFIDLAGTWRNTAAQTSRVDYITSSSTFAVGSEVVVRGHN